MRGLFSARTFVVGQFITVAVLLGSGAVFAKFAGEGVDTLLFLFGTPLLLVSTATVLGWAVWRPNRAKLTVALLALATVVALNAASLYLVRFGNLLFFETRHEQLDVFTRDLLAFVALRPLGNGWYWFATT